MRVWLGCSWSFAPPPIHEGSPTCCSASMRESSLSCRARSDLASSPCSEPTPIELASPWLGRLTGRLEGRQPAGWHGTASGSSTPPPPRMPSGGRGGVSGPATGARASEELWPVTVRAQRTSCRHRLAFRFCCRLHTEGLGDALLSRLTASALRPDGAIAAGRVPVRGGAAAGRLDVGPAIATGQCDRDAQRQQQRALRCSMLG